jgi:hypothetical protein
MDRQSSLAPDCEKYPRHFEWLLKSVPAASPLIHLPTLYFAPYNNNGILSMAVKGFNFVNYLIRFVLALVLVFATYNPSGHSWYHWFIHATDKLDPLLVFTCVVLIIGWVIYVRATLRSL